MAPDRRGTDVDFVVVGLGLGALGVLCGVIILGWVAARWERSAARAASTEAAAYGLAAAADRRDVGQACLYAGGAILLATIGALAGSLDDRTGAFLVATTATVAAAGFLLWRYLHRSQRPLPARRRAAPAPLAAMTAGAVAASSPLRVVPLRDESGDDVDGEDVDAAVVAAAAPDAPDPAQAADFTDDVQEGDTDPEERFADKHDD